MSVSVGPSGPNDVYLNQLDDFLKHTPSLNADYVRHDDTTTLANMAHWLQQQSLYFLYVAGSNQHGQILQSGIDQDVSQLAEGVLVTPKLPAGEATTVDPPKQIYAGGGHSALLTQNGQLFLWGWNEQGQCGASGITKEEKDDSDDNPFPIRAAVPDIQVERVALGFSHTVLIERGTKRLYAFGDNSRGQVDGSNASTNNTISKPTATPFVQNDRFVDVSAGLFHTAAITESGELVTFGCGRKGQCLHKKDNDNDDSVFNERWRPDDGSKLVQVVCGRHHTAALDEKGRLWTFGDNKYGQLGRAIIAESEAIGDSTKKTKTFDPIPRMVDGIPGAAPTKDSSLKCVGLSSGWSHVIARVEQSVPSGSKQTFYGWGRNDKGQLGSITDQTVNFPVEVDNPLLKDIDSVSCGSESTYFWNAKSGLCYCCGWNEHGNLALGTKYEQAEDIRELKEVIETGRVVSPPTYSADRTILLAAGGAHLLVMMS